MLLTEPETTTFEATWIFDVTLRDLRDGVRYVWHEGGSRASKTYNIAPALLLFCAEADETLDVVRLTNPSLKGSVYLDLIETADALGLYDPGLHNKTDQVIYLRGGRGRVRYFGVDDEQKVRGWKRGLLWMNEGNEIPDARRRQLWMRTTRAIVLDNNPSIDDDHWIVKKLEPRVATGDCRRYHSTYLDNPFLEEPVVREIESMQWDDPYGWQVYGLGLRGSNPAAVFTEVELGEFEPQGDTVYGVDFGMRDPFVVCEWGWRDANPPDVPKATLYCRPWLYASNLTTGQAIEVLDELTEEGLFDQDKEMWCDSAEPDRIKELEIAGYNARPVEKRPGSRKATYDWMKRHRIVVDHTLPAAEAAKNDLKRTRHKQKPGSDTYSDDVVDGDDHVADTGRYGAHTRFAPDYDPTPGLRSLR